MTQILTFSHDWYEYIIQQKYLLRSLNQAAIRPWGNAGQAISGPHSQLYLCEVTMAPLRDPLLQDIGALITDLKGRKNVLRIAHAMRWAPWHDRNLSPTTSAFSNGSTFSDGSGFANGFLPPTVHIAEAAPAGSDYVVLGGFPASTANVLRRLDPFEIMPNGAPAPYPHRYECMIGGSSDASGLVGVRIEPRLRVGIHAGDLASLRFASSLFRMIDDNQGDVEGSDGGIGNFGFSLAEAVDLVP